MAPSNLLLYNNNAYVVTMFDLSLYFVRRAFDIERRLDRVECSVTQYSDEGERGVVPVIDVVVRVALFLPRSIPIFQNPVDVSG